MTAALLESEKHSASDLISPRRVPAWKKLGLKLKFAYEDTDQPSQLDHNNSANKRLRGELFQDPSEIECTDHGSKKRPRFDQPPARSTKSNHTNVKPISASLKRDSNCVRKTVSFTSDTKIEDGDSSKTLIADWEAQYDQPSFSADPPKNPEPLMKKVSTSKLSKSRPATKKPPAALEYLTNFRESKARWKFNKSREIWILKHLFSIHNIPPSYDICLSQYLKGMKSSSARSRIRQTAEEIVRKDQEQQLDYVVLADREDSACRTGELPVDMEDPERRRAYYEDSVRRYKRKVEQHLDGVAAEELSWVSPERLAKRRRAEIILWAVRLSPSSTEATQPSDTTISVQSSSSNGSSGTGNGVQTRNVPRKRKNRTSVIELSCSSSEDESSDASGEPGSESEEKEEESDSQNTGTSTTTGTQSSASPHTQEEAGSDEETESSSSSGSRSDESETESDSAATRNGQPRSIISISS